MISDIVRSIVSGVLGATLAEWLARKWSRWMPSGIGSKSKERVMQENARRIRVANRLSLLGCLGGFLLYFTAYLPSDDWRGLGVAAGLAAGLPFLWLIASSISGGAKNVRECLIAYTMSQKAPPPILLGLIILCIAGGIVSAASLIINPPPTPLTEHRSVAPQVQAISGGGSDGGRVVN